MLKRQTQPKIWVVHRLVVPMILGKGKVPLGVTQMKRKTKQT
ncbi:hypothetical protein CEB3_c03040 [Peptococcaceae bacterium CEB3]|nr:hypothetical protein CEB3_c03040 [Peptococcaceae bacterium CEB3]